MPCYKPITIRIKGYYNYGKYQEVGCGQCIGCRLDRSRKMAIRLEHESQMHQEKCFLTLTYNDANLPWGVHRPTLRPRDTQLFLKKLRKEVKTKIRFYLCGEYGEKTSRPHYHAILYGFSFPDKTYYSKTLKESQLLNETWGMGDCKIGEVTFESCAYVARYVMAKRNGPQKEYYNQNQIEPEFSRCSKGIGKSWIEAYQNDVYGSDSVISRGGIKQRPPRYYDLHVANKNENLIIETKKQRLINTKKAQKNLKWEDVTQLRLKQREQYQIYKLNKLDRVL